MPDWNQIHKLTEQIAGGLSGLRSHGVDTAAALGLIESAHEATAPIDIATVIAELSPHVTEPSAPEPETEGFESDPVAVEVSDQE